jgi:DNA (cytosine-5)-methyltransferase 1
MKRYKLKKEFLSNVQNSKLNLFQNEFENITDKYINIDYWPKSYNVNKDIYNQKNKVNAISFFSGAGGLDIGSQLANCKVIACLDSDQDSISTIKSNKFFRHAKHICAKIQDYSALDFENAIKKNNPEKLILLGGPPCQPFSKAGYWQTHEKRLGANDPRNMIGQYLRLIEDIKPDGFVLENVESIMHPKNLEVVEIIEEFIDKQGFNFIRVKSNSADYGVPQKRKRVFFIASKKSILSEPYKTHGSNKEIEGNPKLLPYETVLNWIGEYDKTKYSDGYDSTDGKYYKDLLAIPPGQNYLALTNKRGCDNPKFEAGKRYWSFLLKLHPCMPSWTIIANPGHWEGPFHWSGRRLRLKELAAIQTFPHDYNFFGSRRSIHKQIGNAVPPLMGRSIVNHLMMHL